MITDALYFSRFYISSMGSEVIKILTPVVQSMVTEKDLTLCLGYGFDFDVEGRFFHAPLEHMGILQKHGESHHSTLVDEEYLPFQDETFDRCILIHALEHTYSPKRFLREVWRILKPGGRVIVVVPNRRGLWARFDNTPFGMGQPYTKGQAFDLLEACLFKPLSHKRALFHPPVIPLGQSYRYAETYFYWVFAKFSGVIVIEAEKQVYCPVIKGKRQTLMRPGLVGD